MKRLLTAALAAAMVLAASPAGASSPDRPDPIPTPDERLEAYRATLTPELADALRGRGVDVTPVQVGEDGTGEVELVLTGEEAEELASDGVDVELKTDSEGRTASMAAAAMLEEPDGVFRPYGGPGGIAEELRALAAAHPDFVKLVEIGRSVQGQPILALKMTRRASRVPDGARPAAMYVATQHAREWITPEMVRRLAHEFADGYGTDRELTRLIDRNEYWFVPVANPDGYDYTFTEGNRLWRKNLADNNGDGQITGVDGVDPNRNFPYKWGYDNEGSSPNPSGQTYRGPGPGSEPETQALDGLFARVKPEFLVNYHSAVGQILYGVGWQVATPSPDDAIHVTLAGDDTESAVPGYDPDLSAELYTTNGETNEHAHAVHEILGFTPEMNTCATVSAKYDDDEWEPEDCASVFNFPDDERLIAEEYELNVPFALDVAKSVTDPDNPVSQLGRTAPDFQVDTFAVSHGTRQEVQVNARRELGRVAMFYRVNGRGRQYVGPTREFEGGERYGAENDVYYHYVRGLVTGARPGDSVEVWFKARGRESERFTYTVAEEAGDGQVLVLANEDYDGFQPMQDADAPKYTGVYQAALDANGISSVVWDTDAQGPPDPLGVLSHYDAVVWQTGDNRITQTEKDTNVLGFPDLGVAADQQYTTVAVRDYLNEDGKLFHTGENAGYFGRFGLLFYGDDDDVTQPCQPEGSIFDDCLLYSDDFYQYWLGAYSRTPYGTPDVVTGTAEPFTGDSFTVNGGDGANNQDEAAQFTTTNDVLPPEQFPWFGITEKAAEYFDDQPDPTQPLTGSWYVGATHADESYMRLTRTIDLTGASAAELSLQLSYDTEASYDNVIVEAHPVGSDAWTTLPDANGRTASDVPAECGAGFLLALHPWLERYLTLADGQCTPTGTTGEWHAFTATSGWGPATFDLSAYAGQQVEVSVSYVTDPATGGTGVFVDDTAVTIDGVTTEENGFEETLEPWTVAGPPPGSPANGSDWERSQSLVEPLDFAAVVTTDDTVYAGFGFEAISTEAERTSVMGDVMGYLLRR